MTAMDTGMVRQEIELLLSGNHRSQAREKLAQASEAMGDDLWLWSSRARLDADEGDGQAALHAFRRAVSLAEAANMPLEAASLLEQAIVVADKSGYIQDGFALLKDLVRLQPDDAQINNRVGKRLCDTGRYKAALPYLRVSAPVLRHQDGALWTYSTALALTGGYEELMSLEPLMDEMAETVPPPYGPYRHLAVARLSLTFDRERVLDRIATVQGSSAWLDVGALITQLKVAIAARKPFSFIRMFDGEARFLSYLSPRVQAILRPAELSAMINSIWQSWFKERIELFNPTEVLALGQEVMRAVAAADVTGIASVQMEDADYYHFGFLAEMQDMILEPDGRFYTPALIHHDLHKTIPFLKPLLQDLPFIGFIGCHPELAHRLAQFCNIPETASYLVPGENGRTQLPADVLGTGHFPDIYQHILTKLQIPFEGAVFLVGAGLLGKVYAAKVKQLGGIAIDIGALADGWMGYNTRPGQLDDIRRWKLPELRQEGQMQGLNNNDLNPITLLAGNRVVKINELSIDELIHDLQEKLAQREPASFLRFNDGEGKISGCPQYYPATMLCGELRTHFGNNALTDINLYKLRSAMNAAMQNADWVGVPPDNWPPLFTQARTVLEKLVFDDTGPLPKFTHVSFPQLMLDRGFFDAIMKGRDFVGFVGCRDLRRYFKDHYGVTRSVFINVPEQGSASYSGHLPPHYPQYAETVVSGIKVPYRGALFLVGAGFCGKLYADAIKRKGGIAIDVGSLFDLWAGRFTRPYMNFDNIIAYYKELLEQGDTSPGSFHAVADYYKFRKDVDAEAATIDAALDVNSNHFEFNYRKIDLLLRKLTPSEALNFALTATEGCNFVGAEIFRIAKLFLIAGDRAAGNVLLNLAFNRDPTYEPTLVELANFYMGGQGEDTPDSEYNFFEILTYAAQHTSNAFIISQYARVLGSKGLFYEAIAASEQASSHFSFDSHIYIQKAAWEDHVGESDKSHRSRLQAQLLEAADIGS